MDVNSISARIKQVQKHKPVFLSTKIAKAAASVAAIFRVRPKEPCIDHTCWEASRPLEEWLEQDWVKTGTLELLFIKRAPNPRDPWSGHVAFPGGRQEKGERPFDAATREVAEEIGLDLTNKTKFAFVSQLDDRYTTPFYGQVIHISTFVFIQLTPIEEPMKLATSEVAGVRWVPVEYFRNYRRHEIVYKIFVAPMVRGAEESWLSRASSYSFPGILLPPFPPTVTSPTILCRINSSQADKDTPYVLWGLTLDICDDCFHIMGMNERHQLTERRKSLAAMANANNVVARLIWKLITLPPRTYRVVKYGVATVGAIVVAITVFYTHNCLWTKANL